MAKVKKAKPKKILSDGPIKIITDTDAPLNVKGEKEKSKKPKFLVIGIIAISLLIIAAIIYMVVIIFFKILPEESHVLYSRINSISCFISYSSYINPRDEISIDLTLTNESDTVISDLKSLLIYPPEFPVTITSKDGSSVAKFGTLKAGEKKTRRIKLYLKDSINQEEVPFTLKVTSEKGIEIEDDCLIGIFSFPYIRRISFWFFPSLLSILVVIITSIAPEIAKRIMQDKSQKS